jgi:hypothetical protein
MTLKGRPERIHLEILGIFVGVEQARIKGGVEGGDHPGPGAPTGDNVEKGETVIFGPRETMARRDPVIAGRP